MDKPARYRKQPKVIDAIQWDGTPENATVIIDWVLAGGGTARYHEPNAAGAVAPAAIAVDTLEGTMRANPRGWIIRGLEGEFYPCADSVFVASYEPAD